MKEYTPTVAAIRRACRKIQAGWSEAERTRRAGWAYPPMMVKRVKSETLEDDDDDDEDDDEDDDDRNGDPRRDD